jgi:hypothetical protein
MGLMLRQTRWLDAWSRLMKMPVKVARDQEKVMTVVGL